MVLNKYTKYMTSVYDAILTVDFETVVDADPTKQTETSVWLSSACKLWSEEKEVFNNIRDTMSYLRRQGNSVLCYWHNLAFDGEFLVSYLIGKCGFRGACYRDGRFVSDNMMHNKTIKYLIAGDGKWYCIKIKIADTMITIWDSSKIIPLSVEDAAIQFDTKYRKGEMKYSGKRRPYQEINEKDKDYVLRDSLIMKECMEQAIEFGCIKMTIGSCCEAEFRNIIGELNYRELFPDLKLHKIDEDVFGFNNQYDFCAATNGGGWVYLNKKGVHNKKSYSLKQKDENGVEREVKYSGVKVDGNSHYSSVEHSSSGNAYPYGVGTPFVGKIPEEAFADDKYYFVRVKTRFQLKKDHLPAICARRDLRYPGKEWLETSDIEYNGKYYKFYKDCDGNIAPARADLYLTKTDLRLLVSQYDVSEFEVVCGIYFDAKIGLFDEYIDKYYEIKKNAKTPGERMLAKLFLNNLHGKLQSKEYAGMKKIKGVNEQGIIEWDKEIPTSKKRGYVAAGAAITANARFKTVMICQANYKHLIYSDTDCGDFDCAVEDIVGVSIDQKDLGTWKVEYFWDEANYVKNKVYIQRKVAYADGAIVPEYKITCSGLPKKGKKIIEMAMTKHNLTTKEIEKMELNERSIALINGGMSIEDFAEGLSVQGKLMPKRIVGGIVLIEEDFSIR